MFNMNPFFIMPFQVDLDYSATLAPQGFERFASLIDPGHRFGAVS
jgi:hypothetical protein